MSGEEGMVVHSSNLGRWFAASLSKPLHSKQCILITLQLLHSQYHFTHLSGEITVTYCYARSKKLKHFSHVL